MSKLFSCAVAGALFAFAACEGPELPAEATSSGATSGSGAGGGGSGGQGGSAPDVCAGLGRASVPFSEGPYGTYRGEIAEDFTVPLMDGTNWSLRERWSGCETYVFSTDRLTVSDLDDTSLWVERPEDLGDLVARSPDNVHYFFFSGKTNDADATESLGAMQARIDALIASLPASDADRWRTRLHVVATRAASLEGWLGDVLTGHGRIGLAIDRDQRIRGTGMLADVQRYSSALAAQDLWPWRGNLAYLAHDAQYLDAQADRRAAAESGARTTVTLWDGEVLAERAETTAALPSASEMEAFDTLEIEVEMSCPDPEEIEFGNCGPWDYLAHLFVRDELGADVELARFITSYHRETQWIADATPMLVHLLSGGDKTFTWSFAPSWNPQPTATRLSLHFSNRGKGIAPRDAVFLFAGGAFGSAYNTGRVPASVPIPADAARVELFAITTGHGAEAQSCAEFCNHQHEFTVDGAVHLQEFPQAGTEEGCITELARGMVPNQGGTWWFGRGGWCPGQQVEPFVVDVTADVTPGATATVTYQGLLGGATPPDGAGTIELASYLVVYRAIP
jgi:hypothetical protein